MIRVWSRIQQSQQAAKRGQHRFRAPSVTPNIAFEALHIEELHIEELHIELGQIDKVWMESGFNRIWRPLAPWNTDRVFHVGRKYSGGDA